MNSRNDDDRFKNMAEERIGIIVDELPGFDQDAAEAIVRFLLDKGHHVETLSIEAFHAAVNKPQGGIDCSVLIVPNAASFPSHCSSELKAFTERGGSLLVLGGPLFNRLIKPVGGRYQELEYDAKRYLDATFTDEMESVVIEGFAPTYKVYSLKKQKQFVTEPDQFAFSGKIAPKEPLDLIAPSPRPHGQGHGQKRETRYIPVVQCVGDGGNGNRGAAAFFMLNDTFNHPFSLGGTRPNSVGATMIGSATAGIGFTRQDLLAIPGADSLLTGMLDHLLRGLYLFEAGCASFVHRPNETPTLGAKVLNTRQDYLPVTLRFTVSSKSATLIEREIELLAAPRNISDVHFTPDERLQPGVDYQVTVELLVDGNPVDAIKHETKRLPSKRNTADEFIRVEGDNFIHQGKPWYPVGVNYWPFFFAGVEEVENWYGWLTDKYYDPIDVERDLDFLAKNGFNFLFTRLDGNVFEHSIPQLLDFLDRCRKHNIRVGLGWPEAMSPLYYNQEAVAKFFRETGLQDDPTVLCYDLIWELGGVPLIDKYRRYWDAPWRAWIEERYGSLENAESDWNHAVNRNERGDAVAPTLEQLRSDGDWRIMVAAYRRFMDDFLSAKWNVASRDIRGHAPNQLLTYRMGHLQYTNVSFTATGKHVDFMSPEGYDFRTGEDGYNASCFASRFLDHAGCGKPIVWSEFGMSLTGNVYANQLFWDHENLTHYKEKEREQDALLRQFYKMILDSGCNGLAPWWWSGGIRRKEISDFGLIGLDGVPRLGLKSLIEQIPAFTRHRHRPEPNAWFEFDRDAHAAGLSQVCYGSGRDAYAKAANEGKWLGVCTAGTGTTSANTPLTAVGNTPYNGENPLKYLNAEFNDVILSDDSGNTWRLENDDTVKVPRNAELTLRVNVGNLQEAKWLAPSLDIKTGGVFLVSTSGSDLTARQPIPHDVARFEDVQIVPFPLGTINGEAKLRLRLEAEGRGQFGPIFSVTIKA